MKIEKIKAIAKAKGVKAANLKKPELLQAIQGAVGNFDGFGSAASGYCDQAGCLWRDECVQ